MPTYVALLRGIGPGNPNMRNEKLRDLFESIGMEKVRSVISSGNIIFESPETDHRKLEDLAETAFPKVLGYSCATIIRSQEVLQKLVQANPFNDLAHGPSSYLLATFCKVPKKLSFSVPYHPPDKPYYVKSVVSNTIFTVTDNTHIPTTDIMTWLEKQFGKDISSRTWLTVNRILKKMTDSVQ